MRRIAAPPSAKIASVSAHDQHSGAQVEPTADVERAVLAGVASARLLAEPASWINRRVETIELLTHEETRRRVSIDFTLLPEVRRDLELDDGVVVPISVLTKEPRRKFDLRDESGRAVPVLGRSQNGELAHLALLSAALDVLGADPPADVYEDIAAHLRASSWSRRSLPPSSWPTSSEAPRTATSTELRCGTTRPVSSCS